MLNFLIIVIITFLYLSPQRNNKSQFNKSQFSNYKKKKSCIRILDPSPWSC